MGSEVKKDESRLESILSSFNYELNRYHTLISGINEKVEKLHYDPRSRTECSSEDKCKEPTSILGQIDQCLGKLSAYNNWLNDINNTLGEAV